MIPVRNGRPGRARAAARDEGRLSPGDLLLPVRVGGGLTWASTIVRYEPATWEPER